MFSDAGLMMTSVITDRLTLEYQRWIMRMRTPGVLAEAIQVYQQSASKAVQDYFQLQADGSFTSDTIMIEVYKP